MSEFNKIAKESSINFSGSLVGNILSYVWLMILTRYLSQEDVGNFTLAQSLINISLIFVLLGLHRSLDRFIPIFKYAHQPGKIKALLSLIFRYSFSASLVIGTLLFWGADFISTKLFNTPTLTEVLRIMLFSIPLLAVTNIVINAFIGYKELRYNVYLKQLLEPALRIVIASAIAIWGLGILEWTWLYLISLLFSALAGVWLLYRKIIHPLDGVNQQAIDVKEIISYSWPISIASILIIFIGQIDYVIIGIYHPSADVGVYRIYIQIAALLKLINGSTARIYKPVISEMIQENDHAVIRRTYLRVTKWVQAFTMLGFLVLALYGKELTGLLFTADYSIFPEALTILVLGTLINASFGPEGVSLEAFGNTKLVMVNSLVSLAANTGLGFVLVPEYGITGAAISTAVTLSLGGLLGFLEIYWLYKMQPFSINTLKIAALALVVGALFLGVNSLMPQIPWIGYLFLLVLLTGCYGLGFVILRILDESDRAMLEQIRQKISLNII